MATSAGLIRFGRTNKAAPIDSLTSTQPWLALPQERTSVRDRAHQENVIAHGDVFLQRG